MPEQKKVNFYGNSLMERTEMFIFLLLMVIFPIFRAVLLWSFAGLVFLTAFQRFYHAYRLFYGRKNS
ncbi:MAG: hypothetical protein ACTSWC_10245 [Promethearchaeota archaeon]